MDFAHLATQELTLSFGASLDTKERVKQAVDIVDLVGKYVQLRRQGRNYVALCPWHDDTRPSLQVNPERQSFKCWVCDIGGDVFSFVMKMDGVTFPEALALLADQAGIPLKPNERAPQGKPGGADDKRTLYRVMAWAEKQYHDCLLNTDEAEPARRYLEERGITAESIEKFHLGFSPNRWDWLIRRGQNSGPNSKLLEAVGLLAQSGEGGNAYDRFRGRVLFSIRDVQGRPIGLGGRILPESGATSPAKYINSPETLLFRKSEHLYGLDVARDAIRKSKTAVVMEGYTDVIIAHQYGFENAVAVLGTALGSKHIQILKRFADRIVLLLDGDEAGQKRTNEVLDLFIGENVDLRIATLPDDLDPCDFLLARGAAEFGAVLEGAVDALEHAFRVATRGIDLANDVHRASQALERLVAMVAKAPRLRADSSGEDRFREEKILQRLAASFRVPEKDIRDRMTALRRGSQQRRPVVQNGAKSAPAPESPSAPIDPWQRELLEILLRYPECLPGARKAVRPEQLASVPCRAIFETSCRLADGGVAPTFDRLMLEFDDPAIKALLVELDESGSQKKVADPHALMEEWIRNFEREQVRKRTSNQVLALRQGGVDDSHTINLLRQITEQQRARQGISSLTDGQDSGRE